MNGKVIIGFFSGLAIGGVGAFFGTKYLLEDKYKKDLETQLEAQIKEVRDAFANAKHMERKEEKEAAPAKEPVTVDQAAEAHAKYAANASVNSTDYLKTQLPKKPYVITVEDYLKTQLPKKPYVINVEDYDTKGYDKAEFLYFADGILINVENRAQPYTADQITEICGNMWRDLIGPDNGEIYLRNDAIKTDIAITRDLRKYSDFIHK